MTEVHISTPYTPGGRGPFVRRKKEGELNTNREIKAKEVRLVGDNVEQGIYPFEKALAIAEEQELDLVEISPNANPPVCKVVDYRKYLYEQKKKQKDIKANTVKQVVKEIRFGPNTDDHDFNFKLNHATKFLQEGSKVRAHVFFRGRSIVYKERGEVLLLQFAEKLQEYGKVEIMPKLEGKKMFIMIAPKAKK